MSKIDSFSFIHFNLSHLTVFLGREKELSELTDEKHLPFIKEYYYRSKFYKANNNNNNNNNNNYYIINIIVEKKRLKEERKKRNIKEIITITK